MKAVLKTSSPGGENTTVLGVRTRSRSSQGECSDFTRSDATAGFSLFFIILYISLFRWAIIWTALSFKRITINKAGHSYRTLSYSKWAWGKMWSSPGQEYFSQAPPLFLGSLYLFTFLDHFSYQELRVHYSFPPFVLAIILWGMWGWKILTCPRSPRMLFGWTGIWTLIFLV